MIATKYWVWVTTVFQEEEIDSSLPLSRPSKYGYMVHAETNCILNSQNLLLSGNYTMYVTGMPCSFCMPLIIQSGVKTLNYGPVTSACVDHESIKAVHHLSKEFKVTMRYCGGPFLSHFYPKISKYFTEIQEYPFVTSE